MELEQLSEVDVWAYVSKTASATTIEKVETWKESAEYDDDVFQKISSLYKVTEPSPSKHILDIEKAKSRFFETEKTNNQAQPLWQSILKYAAAIVFIITVTSYSFRLFYKSNEQILVETRFGEQKQVDLPDGSIVYLNASSTLTYNLEMPRTLVLQGEAFFEVAKDKNNPFTVETPDQVIIKALGTSFNVKSYAKSAFTETVLLTGKVEVSLGNYDIKKIIMMPNDKIRIIKSDGRVIKTNSILAQGATAWKQGKIKFSNKTFKEIANDLNIQYDAKIIFENKHISTSKFTGTFDHTTSIKEILEILQTSKHFEFKPTPNNGWIIK